MKFISVRDAKAHLSACLDDSQSEGVIVTHHGKPKSVVIGVENYETEDVVLMLDPNFWRMIESRRKQPRTSLKEFERELSAEERERHRKRKRQVRVRK